MFGSIKNLYDPHYTNSMEIINNWGSNRQKKTDSIVKQMDF